METEQELQRRLHDYLAFPNVSLKAKLLVNMDTVVCVLLASADKEHLVSLMEDKIQESKEHFDTG